MAGQTRAISAVVVPLRTDITGFEKGIDKAKKDGQSFKKDASKYFEDFNKSAGGSLAKLATNFNVMSGGGAKALGLLTGGVIALGAAAIGAAVAVGKIGFDRITDLGKDAAALGTSAEALSRLRSVAKAAAVDVGDLGEFMKGLTSDINASIGKTTNASRAFAMLGTSAEELQKLTPDEQIKKLNKAFQGLPVGDRANVAKLLGGDAGVKLLRLLEMDATKFKETFDGAPIVSDDDVSEIQKLQKSLDKIVETIAHLADMFTTLVAPKITEVTDMLLAFGNKFKGLFGVNLQSSAAIKATFAKPPEPPKAAANTPAQAAEKVADMAGKQAELAKAQALVVKLQEQADKSADNLRKNPGHTVAIPGTNGKYRYQQSNQKDLDRNEAVNQQLNRAKAEAEEKRIATLSPAARAAEAQRNNGPMQTEFSNLMQSFRTSIEESGKDDVHRQVDAIKGLSVAQRKEALQAGYKAREANKSIGLRDELQESTKLPQQKLAEDLNRINQMVRLGAANGGLTRQQGLLAAAQKTEDSGIAGPAKYAGAVQANSVEGRSYLLGQMGRIQDPVAIAQKGLALTGMTNTLLGSILNKLGGGREMAFSL